MTDIALEPLPNPGDEGSCPFDLPPALAKWREEEPVRRISVESGGSAWLVTRHEDVRTALGDHRLSADRNRPGFPHLRADEPPMPPGTFAQYDPPEHTRIRRMLTKAFMPKNVEKLKSLIHETVDELLDAMERQPQPADLYRDFALRLPTLTMCGLLGVPYDDRAVFQENTQAILNLGLPGAEVTAAYERMLAYIGELLDAKGHAPEDDLVSELAVERVATGELTKVEAIGVIALLLISGHDTTATSISLGTIALLREPDQLRRLLAEPDTVPGAVEELLRYLPGLHTGVRRIATADLEIGGVTIRDFSRGKTISIRVGAPQYPTGDDPVAETADLRAAMAEMLDEAIAAYPADEQPPGAWWVPASHGGGAPIPEEAARLDAEEKVRRAAKRASQSEQR